MEIWSYKTISQDIFSFRNLITHIVCRHYVHITHIKFLQETDQMISTGRDLVFLIYLDKYQLGFTLSCVWISGSKTSHIFQGLSCLWRHNDAMIIISLAWFHNLFLWDLCHFRGNLLNSLFWNNTLNILYWSKSLFFPSHLSWSSTLWA